MLKWPLAENKFPTSTLKGPQRLMEHGHPSQIPPHCIGVVWSSPLFPWGPASPQRICAPISKVFQEMVPPKSPYLPLPKVAPELLEVVQGQASAMLEMGHLVAVSVPRRGAEVPTSHPPTQARLPRIPRSTAAAAHRS